MKILLHILISTLLLVGNFNCAIAKRYCSSKDREYAKAFDNYYDPEEAYKFGQKIIDLIKNDDLQGIFALVDGELKHGPRKHSIKGYKFSDIFPNSWKAKIIRTIPPCSPLGGRGFMIGDGEIWFDKKKGAYHIFSINGAKSKTDKIAEFLDQEEQRLGKTHTTHAISREQKHSLLTEQKQNLARPKDYWYKRKNHSTLALSWPQK